MDFSCEQQLQSQGYQHIAGLDEAGRGPLAGPVVAAAVIFDFQTIPDELTAVKDSKILSAKKRAALFSAITKHAVCFSLGICDHETIDRVNILQASLLAMKKACAALTIRPDILLVDGNHVLPRHTGEQRAIVDGDHDIFSIAAASILAKVARDRLMEQAHERWPQYGFGQHKGYGTKMHLEALQRYGPCEIHRKTFKPVKTFFQKRPMSNNQFSTNTQYYNTQHEPAGIEHYKIGY